MVNEYLDGSTSTAHPSHVAAMYPLGTSEQLGGGGGNSMAAAVDVADV